VRTCNAFASTGLLSLQSSFLSQYLLRKMASPSGVAIGDSPSAIAEIHAGDIEMRDASQQPDDSDVDAEGEPEDGDEEAAGRGDLRQLISDVSAYLCEIEEK
jgi:hypothetical protein